MERKWSRMAQLLCLLLACFCAYLEYCTHDRLYTVALYVFVAGVFIAGWFDRCPHCKYRLFPRRISAKYCPNCGQPLE